MASAAYNLDFRDVLPGVPLAIPLATFPQAQVPLCLVHQVRASLNAVLWKQRKPAAADLKPIYQASTVVFWEKTKAWDRLLYIGNETSATI